MDNSATKPLPPKAFDRQRPVSDERRKLIAKVHVAKKQLAMLDDDYRALLIRAAGKESAKDCNAAQLRAVLAEFTRLGFREATAEAPRRQAAQGTVAKKARALWISLGQLGAIDDPSDKALEAFACRQLGVDRMAWMDEREGFKLIEALKAIAERNGWDQSTRGCRTAADRLWTIKNNLITALVAKLAECGMRTAPVDRTGWPVSELNAGISHLAGLLRAMRRNAAR